MSNLKPFAFMGIGSLPYLDPAVAINKVLSNFDIPFWPQLPRKDFKEEMYVQFSEGLPFCRLQPQEHKIYFEAGPDFFKDLETFYEKFLTSALEDFSVSQEFASGLYALRDAGLQIRKQQPYALKGQITGPISFGLYLTTKDKKPVLYQEQLWEALLQVLLMKLKWELKFLKGVYPKLIIFIDEPYMSSYGSALISLSKETVLNNLVPFVEGIHQHEAECGIHCCGNTDWSVLLDTGIDIINFDAYSYADNFFLYPEALKNYVLKGGKLAWGIIPTSKEAERESVESLEEKLEAQLLRLQQMGLSRELIAAQSFITPSCGMGLLSEPLCELIMQLGKNLALKMQKKNK
jgi:hypothetical protein